MYIVSVCEKLGMTHKIENGKRIVLTILKPMESAVAESKKYGERRVVKVAYGSCSEKKLRKPVLGYLRKKNLSYYRHFKEFDLPDGENMEEKTALKLHDSYVGADVKITSRSRGHGFTGTMKRYNFSGLGASHGVSGKHRSAGSIGNCAAPARVFKGKKMAGRHGNKTTTLKSKIEYVDMEQGLIIVRGMAAGRAGTTVFLRSC